MRRSSSRSEAPGGLFDGVLARGDVRAEVADAAWVRGMLDAEAALARAGARAGVIPAEHAEAITRACAVLEVSIEELGQAAALTGNPVVPLIDAVTAAVGPPAADSVHVGATSQDVIDTAMMLVVERAFAPLEDDLWGAAEAAAVLSERHRLAPIAGRTLLQQALPTTFGAKTANWMTGLDEAGRRLRAVRQQRLAVQLGGAVGTLASFGDEGPAVLAAFADELGLAEPVAPWHTDRTRLAEVAGALGEAGVAIGKPAMDVLLLAQTEVSELREGAPGRGASSTMPNKRNPVAVVSARACAMRVPGLVAELLATGVHEHERAAGAWHAEWRPLSDLLTTTGSAAAWLRDCLEHLEVDVEAMRANLDRTGGLVMAERVATALTPMLGRRAANDLVKRAAAATTGSISFADALVAAPEIRRHLSPERIAELLEPAGAVGSAGLFVDRALAAHRAWGADRT